MLTSGRCTYRYDLPLPGREYLLGGGGEANVNVQVEPDLSVLLLPQSARSVVDPASVQAFQRYGFPIRPVAKTCV
jgi:hypothetical protein